jgi:endogenous inhibitor of DNA gyrase (YacG/DUF329 family)
MKIEGECKICKKPFSVRRYGSNIRVFYCSLKCKHLDYQFWNSRYKNRSMPHANNELDLLKNIFDLNVIKNDGCWDSRKKSYKNGYIPMVINGQQSCAHRASWIIHYGAIPDGLFVLHNCDNRRCSNPAHLFLGTAKDNSKDMEKKGRKRPPFGEAHKLSKLKSEQVIKIKELIKMGVTATRIAKDFEVHPSAIRAIRSGITWKHVLIK